VSHLSDGPLGSTNDAALEDAMTLPTIDQARSWRGLTLVAIDDEPVGEIEAIYVDRSTRQPEWALVQTGLFGGARTFVPLADAAQRGDTIQVPHETSVVREAPRLQLDAELSEEDEARLYAHYGISYTTGESSSGLAAGETASTGGGAAAARDATTELPPSSRLEADAPAAAGGLSAAGSMRAARTATRTAVQAGQQAATSGRLAVHKARQEVAAVVDAIETTPESKRKARKRARARKRAMAAAAGAARSVAAALASAWRRVRKSDAG
jgi:hypothetical protein